MASMFRTPLEDELRRVSEMRERLQNVLQDDESRRRYATDIHLLRFLRGRAGDLDKAMKAFTKHLEWRKEHNADLISETDCPIELSKVKTLIHGNSRSGCPVIYCFAHRHDSSDRDPIEFYKYIIYTFETLIKKTNPEEEKTVFVFDLSKFSFKCMDLEITKMLVSVLQMQYPETLDVAYMLDAPWIFQTFWSIVKPWLDPATAAKVQFCPSKDLEKYISADNIPTEFGTL